MDIKKIREKIKNLKEKNDKLINPSYDAYFKITEDKILIIQKQSKFAEEEIVETIDK